MKRFLLLAICIFALIGNAYGQFGFTVENITVNNSSQNNLYETGIFVNTPVGIKSFGLKVTSSTADGSLRPGDIYGAGTMYVSGENAQNDYYTNASGWKDLGSTPTSIIDSNDYSTKDGSYFPINTNFKLLKLLWRLNPAAKINANASYTVTVTISKIVYQNGGTVTGTYSNSGTITFLNAQNGNGNTGNSNAVFTVKNVNVSAGASAFYVPINLALSNTSLTGFTLNYNSGNGSGNHFHIRPDWNPGTRNAANQEMADKWWTERNTLINSPTEISEKIRFYTDTKDNVNVPPQPDFKILELYFEKDAGYYFSNNYSTNINITISNVIDASGNQMTYSSNSSAVISFDNSNGTEVDELTGKIISGISPNPVTNQSQFFYRLRQNGFVNIAIMDDNGKNVASPFYPQQQTIGDYLINLPDLPNGTYTLLFTINDYSNNYRFVVNK